MDRFEAMAVLLRVVERRSFSAAARELGVPLASVSRKVAELEAQLGTRLLVRTTRSVAPTDAGISYATAAKRILEAVDEAERTAAGEFEAPRGVLALTAPVLFGRLHILPVIAEFLVAYPEIDVQLLLSDRNLHLIDDHVDIAVRFGALPDSGLVANRIGVMRTVVCAAPKLLASHGVPAVPRDLAALPVVNFDFLAPAATWSFRQDGEQSVVEVPIRPRLSVSTAEAAVCAAAAGIGATRVLHYQCADALREGSLRIVLSPYEPAPLPVHLLHSGGRALASKIRAFLDFAAPRLRGQLAGLPDT